MLEKFLKNLGLGKDDKPDEPVATTDKPALAEVMPEAGVPAVAPVADPLVDTGNFQGSSMVTQILEVETYGARNNEMELRTRFVARQPLLDRNQSVIGYELLLRKREESAELDDPALMRLYDDMLLRSLVSLEIGRLLDDKQALVSLSVTALDHRLLKQLPPKGMILAIQLPDPLPEHVPAQLQALKAEGYQIALDNLIYVPGREPLLALADFIRLDVKAYDALDLKAQAEVLRDKCPARLIACNVNAREDYEVCRNFPFHVYQGYFFVGLNPAEPARIDNERGTVLELLNMVRIQAEISELERVFRRDPALSYNLLRYINSPGSGMLQEIRSIAHALIIMGYQQLYRWLTLLLFTSGGSLDQRAKALMKSALVRGRLVELLGFHKLAPADREGLFIVGVFSLLDTLLNTSMDRALGKLKLPQPVLDALMAHKGMYAPYLDLALACEQGDAMLVEALAHTCALDADAVNLAHIQALIWAEEVDK